MSADLIRTKHKFHVGEEVILNLDSTEQFSKLNGKRGTVTEIKSGIARTHRGEEFIYVVTVKSTALKGVKFAEIICYERELEETPEAVERQAPPPEPKAPEVTLRDVVAALNKDMKLWRELMRHARFEDLRSELERRARLTDAQSTLTIALERIEESQKEAEEAQRVIKADGEVA